MRLSQIQEGVLYATCDGNMVKAVTPISNKWYRVPKLKEDGTPEVDHLGRQVTTFELLDTPPQDDPWAKCKPSSRPPTTTKPGVLVEVFQFDDNGEPVKSLGRMTVRHTDIGGLWQDYLLLHGEDVIAKATKWRLQEEIPTAAKELGKRLRETGLQFPVGNIDRRSKGDIKFYGNSSDSSSVHSEVREFHRPEQYIEGPPAPPMYPVVTVTARNETDVEYLLEVLRLGVQHRKSLEKRRQRDANRRRTT